MKIRVKEVRILHVNLPLKKSFKHALTTRTCSDSIFLKVLLEGGASGYGEALPREYVTGETPGSVMNGLKKVILHRVLGYGVDAYNKVPWFINGLDIERGAARCALEFALLDAYGRHFKVPLYRTIGKLSNKPFYYSGVLQAGSVADAVKKSLLFRAFGFKFIKVKVGVGNDLKRLKVARKILGKDVNIRVDANCAWSADEAIERIDAMRKFNISAVEQPVRADDYHELKKVTESVPEAVIADESLCTVDDAERLSRLKACNIFNIRLSKCGGILNSFRIANIARRSQFGVQLGCQVGESGLLSAAGWHFASVWGDMAFCEGAYGRYLLKQDATEEDITIRRGGVLEPVTGPGLGVNVSDKVLDKYTVSSDILKA